MRSTTRSRLAMCRQINPDPRIAELAEFDAAVLANFEAEWRSAGSPMAGSFVVFTRPSIWRRLWQYITGPCA